MALKRWEAALLVSLLVTVLFCLVPVQEQNLLSGKLTRLHVLANSDEPADQQLKLQVRDTVLSVAAGENHMTEDLLQRMQTAAQQTVVQAGYDYDVEVRRERYFFDTRRYETFSLPAGEYDSVRVIIGEGAGKNWWCVVAPPLCAGICEKELEEIAASAGLSEKEISLICEKNGYVLRFQLVDLWGKLVHKLREL